MKRALIDLLRSFGAVKNQYWVTISAMPIDLRASGVQIRMGTSSRQRLK